MLILWDIWELQFLFTLRDQTLSANISSVSVCFFYIYYWLRGTSLSWIVCKSFSSNFPTSKMRILLNVSNLVVFLYSFEVKFHLTCQSNFYDPHHSLWFLAFPVSCHFCDLTSRLLLLLRRSFFLHLMLFFQ